MPIHIRTTQAGGVEQLPLEDSQLPVELYLRVRFDHSEEAAEWCEAAGEALHDVRLSQELRSGQRLVLWGPPPDPQPFRRSGRSYAFVSPLAISVLRALSHVRVPHCDVVSLSELDAALHLYVGSEIDARAYSKIRVD
jgi:hypothetical protein